MNSRLKPGMYLEMNEIVDFVTWRRVINALIEAGFCAYDGAPSCNNYYLSGGWRHWKYVGVTPGGYIFHSNTIREYAESYITPFSQDDAKLVSLELVLSGGRGGEDVKRQIVDENNAEVFGSCMHNTQIKAKTFYTVTFNGVTCEGVTSEEISEMFSKVGAGDYE